MKLKKIIKKGLPIIMLYLTFTLFLFAASDRIERLDKIEKSNQSNQTSLTINDGK